MEVLSVIEHESLPIRQSRGGGQKALEHAHARTLARLEKKLPVKAWTWEGRDKIKFRNYCGVISLGNLSIEILPKIYHDDVDPGFRRDVLVRMLSKARRLKLRRAGTAQIATQKHSLLDVFILHFCEQLHAQMKQGVIRTYIERNENLNVLRGRLRIEQQFKQNLAHRERLFCQYDELSEDNHHNQTLKYVLKILLKKATGNSARLQVAELLMRFDPVSDIVVDTALVDSLGFDRSTTRYEAIFDQCKWFLKSVHPDVLTGKETCASFLFDMNQLFEAYVSAELRKEVWGKGLRVREQGPKKYFAERKDTGKRVFMMKPDIVFMKGKNEIAAIADAKWKLLNDAEKKLGISQADLYQMGSYATRYGVRELFLIYPMQKKLTKSVQLAIKGSGAMLNIMPLDVTASGSPDLLTTL